MDLPLLTAFILAALVHLCACLAGYETLKRITKPLLLPLLLAFYLLSAGTTDWLAVPALLFGFLGDVALGLPRPAHENGRSDPFLLAGLSAFLLGHLFYIAVFLRGMAAPPPLWTVSAAVCLALALFLIVFRSLRAHMGDLMLPGTAYLLVLLAMACTAAVSGLAAGAPVRILGGALFVASDYILARSILLGKARYTDFFVMLTYIAAQSALTASLIY